MNINLHILENTNELQFLTVNDIAKLLKVKKQFVRELIDTYQLKALRLSKRRTRIAKSAFEDFIKQEMDKPLTKNNNVQPPRRGRKPNGTI